MQSNLYPIATVKQILNADGDIVSDTVISVLLTDSRRAVNTTEALFFALNGRRDGHGFIAEAYSAGVRNFVVTYVPLGSFKGANFLIVHDTLKALQRLAAYHRNQFNLQVIGITGSNGKTIVKEWLYQLLSPDKNVVRSPRSFNSQLGVPLSVWQINDENQVGLFEAGISTVGEMETLEQIIKPSIGILTHLGTAHNEGFESFEQKVIEKLKLFRRVELLIGNYEILSEFGKYIIAPKQFTWSRKSGQADLYVFNETIIGGKYQLRGRYKDEDVECLIPFIDDASVENAITCWAAMLALGYDSKEIAKRLENLTAVRMRLELKNGINNCTIIDDSYNSDMQSLEIALNFLGQQNQHKTKTVILSDIYQSGLANDVLYKQVAALIDAKNINRFIGIGDALTQFQRYFKVAKSSFFPDTESFLEKLNRLGFRDETILIKGSRAFKFERVSKALTEKAHQTVMEINLNAMVDNLNFYRSKLRPQVKVMAMVKAFAYGSGTFEIANVLQYAKVDYLAVAFIDEGVSLRQNGIKLPIMVLNPDAAAFDKMVEHNLEPEIYSFNQLNEFVQFAEKQNLKAYPVHLKIDTGMHRLGFDPTEVTDLCNFLKQTNGLKVQSVFSHLVASDNPQHDEFTRLQIAQYETAVAILEDTLGYKFIRHIANTSAITRWPGAQYDMVRLGIGLYGIDAAIPEESNGLQYVATLKTNVSQVKKIMAGETVGYNRTGKFISEGEIATIRIGYADGYLRAFGNGVGQMLVKGKLAPTVGNIAMDMCMIDVTGLDVKEGDEVIVFNHRHRVEELAKQIGTIPYEILTNVSQRVKRVYFYE